MSISAANALNQTHDFGLALPNATKTLDQLTIRNIIPITNPSTLAICPEKHHGNTHETDTDMEMLWKICGIS